MVDQSLVPVPFTDLVAQHHNIADRILAASQRVFESQAFILGEEVAALEREIAEYCGAKHAIGCASGTDALILSMMALDIGPGAEVITSPFTFFATASAIHRLGARPVFVDIEPGSYNLDVAQVEVAVTPKTKAIMPVHLFGQTVEMESLRSIAKAHGLSIVEDAYQAIGAQYFGRHAGVLGDVGCFSFFPTKNLGGAGDGGMITTDKDELAARIRRLRVHGDIGGYEHVEIGLNSRLDALQAAILRVKLEELDAWTDGRIQNAARYDRLIQHYGLADAVEVPVVLPNRRHVFNQYSVRVTGGRRDQVLQSLRADKLGCAVYYPKPLHLQTCFDSLGYQAGDFPVSEATSQEVLSLPIFAEITAQQQERVVRGMARALGNTGLNQSPLFPEIRGQAA
ncbi:MAG: DegT/DnrJ/EryC1/StrS family aminotransferase [Planctomycetota bacterium]|nr:DegT/DnrJ/EryC1/StrS family aminotransferase [Planctomycetota bacterium]